MQLAGSGLENQELGLADEISVFFPVKVCCLKMRDYVTYQQFLHLHKTSRPANVYAEVLKIIHIPQSFKIHKQLSRVWPLQRLRSHGFSCPTRALTQPSQLFHLRLCETCNFGINVKCKGRLSPLRNFPSLQYPDTLDERCFGRKLGLYKRN